MSAILPACDRNAGNKQIEILNRFPSFFFLICDYDFVVLSFFGSDFLLHPQEFVGEPKFFLQFARPIRLAIRRLLRKVPGERTGAVIVKVHNLIF